METIKISGKYSFDDYKRTNKLNKNVPQWLTIISNIIYIVMYMLFAIALIYSILTKAWYWLPLLVLLFAVLFLSYWYAPRRMRKVFFQEKYFQVPFEIEITEKQFSITNEIAQIKQEWKDYVKWTENRDLILLYSSEASVRIIPKRFLTDENDGKTIIRLLRENGVPRYQGPIGPTLIFIILYLLIILYIFYTVFW